jgi:Flp pilus assembly protein TadD
MITYAGLSNKTRLAAGLFLFLLINSGYIAAFPAASLFYMGNVVAHLAAGLALMWVAMRFAPRYPRESGLFLAAGAVALFLVARGNTLDHRSILWLHIGLGVAAAVLVAFRFGRQIPFLAPACVVAVLLPASAAIWSRVHPDPYNRIVNPPSAPLSMDEEGLGAHSPFAPSSARTTSGKVIPSNFFMDSEGCGECHKDIYEEWKSSVHHMASFNNQFYRKSIEYMQSVNGTRGSKWCAGCHDHAVFFNGRFDRPISEQIDTPEARAGLGCMSCHAIVHVGSTMGNGDFVVEYPALHELASSKSKPIRAIASFLTYLNPQPHRQIFLKPFMRESEFCSACHKVHLDVPVDNYRWLRGFNDYDNWQASGISGQGARSFYYPAKSMACADCHMPLVKSKDPGNRQGQIHSHRFAAANTAVAYVDHDQAQLEATKKFLQSGFISVDIFAVSPVEANRGEAAMVRRSGTVESNSTFAVGEEAESSAPAVIRDVGQLSAPLGSADTHLEPGSTARVDVVVRTRKIGHFFPAGTVDAFDTWLEFQARDDDGRLLFWSGKIEDDGKGPVEPGAHFYRSYQLDGAGNPINKRNAWQTRSLLYVRLIPPGAADVAHYRVKLPKDAKGPIHFTAKLNYRKFSWYFTQFAYAGAPKPGQSPSLVSKEFNSLEYSFQPSSIPANVSGEIRDRIPDLPTVTLAEAKATVPLGRADWTPAVRKQDRERWNDWGIGLLLQGDLKGAEYAFKRVTEAEPGYADGWLNVARTLIQEGETEAAKPYLAKALAIQPRLGRAMFFQAAVQKADGDYEGALRSLAVVREQYPRDRVALNQIARVQFLQRQYAAAVETLKAVNAVDPEDVQMHYTMMLCYRGLGDAAGAQREETLFRRFKADEASQSITETRRRVSPEDNNERQAIHDHESVALGEGK